MLRFYRKPVEGGEEFIIFIAPTGTFDLTRQYIQLDELEFQFEARSTDKYAIVEDDRRRELEVPLEWEVDAGQAFAEIPYEFGIGELPERTENLCILIYNKTRVEYTTGTIVITREPGNIVTLSDAGVQTLDRTIDADPGVLTAVCNEAGTEVQVTVRPATRQYVKLRALDEENEPSMIVSPLKAEGYASAADPLAIDFTVKGEGVVKFVTTAAGAVPVFVTLPCEGEAPSAPAPTE